MNSKTLTWQEVADALCVDQNISRAQLGEDILAVCDYLEEAGNTGFSADTLKARKLPTYFLAGAFEAIFKGILFYNLDEHYNGYMLRRKPAWLEIWCSRFGPTTRCEEYTTAMRVLAEQKLRDEVEALRPKRAAPEFVQGAFDAFTTRQIGQRYALACVLIGRVHALYLQNRAWPWKEDLNRFAYEVSGREEAGLVSELHYRRKMGDKEAAAILSRGSDYYYTAEAQQSIIDGSADPLAVTMLDPLPPVPQVVHVRSDEWRYCKTEERLYIGRKMKEFKASPWANPHKVGSAESNRAESIAAYERDLLRNPDLLARIPELKSYRVIGCWCKAHDFGELDKACHGDVLVKYAALGDDTLEHLIQQAIGEAD